MVPQDGGRESYRGKMLREKASSALFYVFRFAALFSQRASPSAAREPAAKEGRICSPFRGPKGRLFHLALRCTRARFDLSRCSVAQGRLCGARKGSSLNLFTHSLRSPRTPPHHPQKQRASGAPAEVRGLKGPFFTGIRTREWTIFLKSAAVLQMGEENSKVRDSLHSEKVMRDRFLK